MLKLIFILTVSLSLSATAMDAVDFLRISIQKTDQLSSSQKEGLLAGIAKIGRYKASTGTVHEGHVITAMASVHIPDDSQQTHREQEALKRRAQVFWVGVWKQHLADSAFPGNFPDALKKLILQAKMPPLSCTLKGGRIHWQEITPEEDLFLLTIIPLEQIHCDKEKFLSSYRSSVPVLMRDILNQLAEEEDWDAVQLVLKGYAALGSKDPLLAPSAYLAALSKTPDSAELPTLLQQTAAQYSALSEKWKNRLLDAALATGRNDDVDLLLNAEEGKNTKREEDK